MLLNLHIVHKTKSIVQETPLTFDMYNGAVVDGEVDVWVARPVQRGVACRRWWGLDNVQNQRCLRWCCRMVVEACTRNTIKWHKMKMQHLLMPDTWALPHMCSIYALLGISQVLDM